MNDPVDETTSVEMLEGSIADVQRTRHAIEDRITQMESGEERDRLEAVVEDLLAKERRAARILGWHIGESTNHLESEGRP